MLLFSYVFTLLLSQSECFTLFSTNVSTTLDNLLTKGRYDSRLRPDMGGPPTVVTVNMHIKSMGPISETEQMYKMDVYFRQTWFDRRLKFQLPGLEEFSMSWLFLEKVWKPDTFFMNGKTSHLHRITSPNKFLRLRHDGYIVYSMRLTISASCKMHLKKFPMDSQLCPLLIGSYGYTVNDVLYEWKEGGVGLEPGIELSQYDLVNISTQNKQIFVRGGDTFSMIQASFLLRRNLGFFILQMYVPCTIIVCCSWVSFWINPDDVPGRVYLALITILSITTIGFGGRAALPKVSYPTALDWFIILCFAFVFGVIVEYTVINFIDKATTDIKRLLQDREDKLKLEAEEKEKKALLGDQFQEDEQCEDKNTLLLDELPIEVIKPVPKILMTCELDDFDCSDPEYEDDDEEVIVGIDKTEAFNIEQLKVPIIETKLKVTRSVSVPTLTKDDFGQYRFDNQPMRFLRDTTIDVILDDIEPVKTVSRISFRSTMLIPVKFWRNVRILPTEEDVINAEEPPEKFTRIDIYSRVIFPLSFFTAITIYALNYLYYAIDETSTLAKKL